MPLRLLTALITLQLLVPAASQTANAALSGGSYTSDSAHSGPVRDEALDYLLNLPETNPYRAPLLRLKQLPSEERDALEAWLNHTPGSESADELDDPVPALNDAQLALTRELSAALVAASSAPAASSADWPLIPNEDPISTSLPAIGLTRQLAQLAIKTSDALPPGEAIAVYAAAAQLGRQQRSGTTLIEQLTGVAVEGIALSAASRRLLEYSPDQLRRLSEVWASLHPSPSNADAFKGERDSFFRPIVEKIIRPGLVALLAEDPASFGLPDADTGFTRDLRLSGLMDLGDGERRISLENIETGATFSIIEGKSTEGIELLSLDFARHEAVIRRGTREAVIHLETKKIVERSRAIDRLQDLFKGSEIFQEDSTGLAALRTIADRARRHPRGLDGYVDDIYAEYQRTIDAQVAAAENPQLSNEPTPSESGETTPNEDPLLFLSRPTFGRVARSFNSVATQQVMLQAAINHRLGKLNQSIDPFANPDPWAEKENTAFTLESAEDGGFILRSRYEVRPGQPLTYKFAAPDAGFVRPESKK